MLLTPSDGPKLAQADLILVDGVAERSEPLATLLRNQAGGLAQGGQLVLRSLVLCDERAATSARFREWINGEPIRPRLRTSDELTRIVQEARLTIATTSSTSDDYAQDVERLWGDALDRIRALHRDRAGRALIPTLLAEGERWRRRIELIRDGVIGVRQVVARKRDRGRF
jgi:cyclopropane fatty-acyl-phospholipid synthase-like methyltransferase